ncbi:hypothetical protein [Methanospirillum lacunae]|nr:hypothetical protein [Methanospirillum lacunae]
MNIRMRGMLLGLIPVLIMSLVLVGSSGDPGWKISRIFLCGCKNLA